MAGKEQTKSFVLRVDAATMEALESWAADEFRSINGQLQWIIAEALRKSGRVRKSAACAAETVGEHTPRAAAKVQGESMPEPTARKKPE